MLQDIVNGSEKSDFILITDEADCCGKALLLNFILESLNRYSCVVLACQERPPQFFKSFLPQDVHYKVRYVQLPSYSPTEEEEDIFVRLTTVIEILQQESCAVIIDSLSPQLLVEDTSSVCQALHRIRQSSSVCQTIALLHRDVHDESTHNLLRYQASTVLELCPGPQEMQMCNIRHCRRTGKVIKSSEAFTFDDSFLVKDIQPLKKVDGNNPKQIDEEPDKTDPMSQLTFNLSLSSSEKEARSHVVLPYTIDRLKEEPVSQSRIYYQADDVDDFDEEDPDDDLNI